MASLTTPEQIKSFRMFTLLKGLELEIKTGMRMSRGRTAYAIIKSEFGLRGNKQNVYNQFKEMIES